jgi:hypothetical protein
VLVATGQSERITESIDRVRMFTAASPGPSKTQNKTQWEYIATVAIGVLRVVKFVPTDAIEVLEQRYDYNCVDVLSAIAKATTE